MQKLLTIIVPTYNMEAYLDKCLTSLIVGDADSRLMQELEVLVINDGSTDRSSQIAHGYEARYPATFRVVDKENGNYGSCINAALPLVTGKYVKVLDADDWFDTAVLAEYLAYLQGVDADMVCTDYETFNAEGKKLGARGYRFPPMQQLRSQDYLAEFLNIFMHGVTYRSSLFCGLDYHQTEGIFYTDMEWVYLPLARVATFVYFPKVLYRYLLGRPGQSMERATYLKNVKMLIKGILVYLDIYQSCLQEGGTRHGLTVNMDYLRTRCLARVGNAYLSLLSRHGQEESMSNLNYLDETIRTNYPAFYQEMEAVVYPNYYFPRLRLPFHFIRCWHRHGTRAAALQVWAVNHSLGLSSRLTKLLHYFGLKPIS